MDSRPERVAWTVAEAAAKTGTSKFAVYEAIKAGEIRAVRRGRRYLISDSALREFAGETAHAA